MGQRQRQGKREEGQKMKKSKEKERNRGTEREPPTPSWANDALIGDEEQYGKTERNRVRVSNPAIYLFIYLFIYYLRLYSYFHFRPNLIS